MPPTTPEADPSTLAVETDTVGPRIGDRLADRFTLLAMLGAGAHGVVYEARDESSGRRVALKILSRLDPDELYRFKREFRVLADVSDEHLVTLHELFIDDAGAFFTMELVRGTDLLSWVRGEDFEQLDEERLRGTLWQLCEGLESLHGFGRLHRDLKPSNVLVSDEGHVSVADFGLAEELAALSKERELVGTPAYMSPEQAVGHDLTPASDWYGVGVILYEALTGTLPFAGSFGMQMLMAKQGAEPPPPSSVDPDLPPDLDNLCVGLLRRLPEERITGPQILEFLGRRPSASWSRSWVSKARGRVDELRQLHDAFAHTREGRAAVFLLHGRSGMGKTTLLDAFVEELHGTAVVLRGRCYERESLPYKGLDALVDELRAHVHREDIALTAIGGSTSLVQLFPVLADVPGIGDVPSATFPEDPVERRRQAVTALGQVLLQLVQREPLVLVLDDLQWCDADTVAVLVALLRPPTRPGVLVIGSYRDEDLERTSPIEDLRAELERLRGEVRLDVLAVEPLPPEAARELAEHLLGAQPDAQALAQTIAAEAEGNPLFIAELVRSVLAGRRLGEGVPLTLDDVIRDRAAALPPEARALLELSVLASGPLAQAVVTEAAQVEAASEMLALLRSRSFVRTGGPLPTDPLEPFHDRIRTAIAATLDDTQRAQGHARLAAVLEREHADPDSVATHLLGAGEAQRAGEYVAQAAATASESLAFERAARLYALALELVPGASAQSRWRQARAEALAHAGRSAESAAAYRDAYHHAPDARQLSLQRNAAEQWLRSGRIDEGIRELSGVFEALGLRLPSDPRIALAGFLWQRTRIRLRGTEFIERDEAQIDPRLLLKVDTTWTAATGLQQSNVMVGQYFQAQHLLFALEAGEPHRVARALGVEAIYASTSGSEGAAQVDELLERVLGLARRLDDPRAHGIAHLAAAAASLYRGRFVGARPHLEQAQSILRSKCTNVAWELSMVRTYLIMVLYHLGDIPGLERTMTVTLADADERDDVHTSLLNRLAFGPMPALAAGDLDGARAILADCEAQWPSQMQTSTYVYVKLLTRGRLERYARRPAAAWEAFEEHWPTIVRSLMLTKQPFRIFLLHDRACTALWLAWDSEPRKRRIMLDKAAKDARVLLRQGTRWGTAMGESIAAVIDHARGHGPRALDRALAAERGLAELGMRVFAACMTRRRGEMLGGDEGDALVAGAVATMEASGIVAHEAMANMLMPPALGW